MCPVELCETELSLRLRKKIIAWRREGILETGETIHY